MNSEIILFGLSDYGLKESPGEKDNELIMSMALELGFTDYKHDQMAWCSLFANYCAWKCGYERSGRLNARSWLNFGVEVKNPELGDVVILWRNDPKGWEGHVGFFVNINQGVNYMLAGNQGDMVSIEGFPQSRVLGYRRLKKI